MSNTLNGNIYLKYIILKISFRSIIVMIEIYFRIIILGYIFVKVLENAYFLALGHDFSLRYIRK